jgi:hypothetical protein
MFTFIDHTNIAHQVSISNALKLLVSDINVVTLNEVF